MAEDPTEVGQPANLREVYEKLRANSRLEFERQAKALEMLERLLAGEQEMGDELFARLEAEALTRLQKLRDGHSEQRKRERAALDHARQVRDVARTKDALVAALFEMSRVLDNPALEFAGPEQLNILVTVAQAVITTVGLVQRGTTPERIKAVNDKLAGAL